MSSLEKLIRALPGWSVQVAWLDDRKTWGLRIWKGPTSAALRFFEGTDPDLEVLADRTLALAQGKVTDPPEPTVEPPSEQASIAGFGWKEAKEQIYGNDDEGGDAR